MSVAIHWPCNVPYACCIVSFASPARFALLHLNSIKYMQIQQQLSIINEHSLKVKVCFVSPSCSQRRFSVCVTNRNLTANMNVYIKFRATSHPRSVGGLQNVKLSASVNLRACDRQSIAIVLTTNLTTTANACI